LNKKSLSTSRHISSGLPRPFEIEKTRCSEQKDAFRDKENYVSLLPWMFISLFFIHDMPVFKVGFVVVFDRRCKDTNNM